MATTVVSSGKCHVECHITAQARARLTRGVAGALFTMIMFTTALFTAAHHFAG
jgi:hypothetical protein